MALSCGSKCAKFFLVAFNIILSLLALVLIALGIFVIVGTNRIAADTQWSTSQFGVLYAAAGIIIGVGVAIVLICCLGCCGAIKENTGCLICYAVIVFCLVIIQIVAFIMAAVFSSKINSGLHDGLTTSLQSNYSTNPEAPATKSWDNIQRNLHCCGVDSPSDWKTSEWKKNVSKNVPTSCCVANSTGFPLDEAKCQQFAYLNGTLGSNYVYTQGCLLKLEESTKPQLIWFICIILLVIFIQIILGIMACCLNSSIKSSYEKV